MKKYLYVVEFAVLLWFILPYPLHYHGSQSLTFPSLDQVKNSVSITSQGSSAAEAVLNGPPLPVVCGNPQSPKTGFPFAYKTDDGCGKATNYKVGMGIDYAVVIVLALVIVKLTSLVINRLWK